MMCIKAKVMFCILFLLSPLLAYGFEVPYYQIMKEKNIWTFNIGVQASMRVSETGTGFQIYPTIPFNLETVYRHTTDNIFGYSAILVEIPFFNKEIINNIYGSVFLGLAWYVFDRRNDSGIGWSQMMAIAGSVYVVKKNIGGGVRLASRWNYGIHKHMAFNLGIDLDYAAVQFYTPQEYFYIGPFVFEISSPLYHTIHVGFTIGFTFYL